jgi:glutathione peroxidase
VVKSHPAVNGEQKKMDTYRRKTLLIVNVASRCGFTPQYRGLETLSEKYRDKGLVELGYHCNQFGSQEPADEAGIKIFCSLSYNVTFPLSAKTAVNGHDAHLLCRRLKSEKKGLFGTEAIK